ncbi:MAG TPA: hypothetical protein PK847_02205 [Candidatus Sumerlaeota bacterium]|nr:hypothetical protein [Candidatus Sumerlaeota bacterium]
MRPAAPLVVERSAHPRQRPVWLLEIETPGGAWRGASRPVSVGAAPWPCRLGRVQFRERLPETGPPGGWIATDAEVDVIETPTTAGGLRAAAAPAALLGARADLALAWLDPEAPPDFSLNPGDRVTLLRGVVVEFQVQPASLRVRLADPLHARASRPVGRLLHAALAGGEGPAVGRPLPWIFGRASRAELLPLRTGVATRLAADLAADATIVAVESLDGFPPAGYAQVGGELILYHAVSTGGQTLGHAGSPVTREGAHAWTAGTEVRLRPPEGFVFLAADHPCHAVTMVFGDDRPAPTGDWTADDWDLGGVAAQAVRLSRWPTDPAGWFARRICAAVEGLELPDGTLMENPADVIQCLLTHPRLLGLDASRLDLASFAGEQARLAAAGYRYARRLTGAETLGALIAQAAAESALLVGGEPIRLLRLEPTSRTEDAELHLHDASVVDPRGRRGRATSHLRIAPAGDAGLTPTVIELIGKAADGLQPASFSLPAGAAPAGAIPKRISFHWLSFEAAGAVAEVAEVIGARLAAPRIAIDRIAAPRALLSSTGAAVLVTDAALGLDALVGWIEDVTCVDFEVYVRIHAVGTAAAT